MHVATSTCFFFILLHIFFRDIGADNVRIGAFNVQVFGQSKAAKPDVMDILAQTVQRYDIVLIQEIRDSKQTAIYELITLVNQHGPNQYDLVVSDRLGRSSSKEQYAFIYRLGAGIRILDTHQYADPDEEFEREPFAVRVASDRTNPSEFVLAGVHIDPDEAVQEIDALVAVHDDLREYFHTDNIAIMGDFNADCSYVGKAALKELALRDPMYTWLISDHLDTTTKATDCAYDRIVMTGEAFIQSVVPDSAIVFRYDQVYGLTDKQTTDVSDHYPIEFEMTASGARGHKEL